MVEHALVERFSDEWFTMVLQAADALAHVPGVSFNFDAEITEAPGKVRAHGRVADGQLISFAAGKFVPAQDGETVDVSFAAKAARLLPVLDGQLNPLVAYMRGQLKIDGAYERVVDHLANQGDRVALETFRQNVAAATTQSTAAG